MKPLQAIFPHASADTVAANPQWAVSVTVNPKTKKNDVQVNVARIKGKRGGPAISMSGEPYWSEGKRLTATIRRGKMNRTESEFALILEAQKRKGEILRWEFEGITLRFAGVRYTPDFVVFRDVNLYPVGTDWMYFVEVKGPFSGGKFERAVERFRHAKTYYGDVFEFELHRKTKEGWKQII